VTVPSNLIPVRVTELPRYEGHDPSGYTPYSINGKSYRAQLLGLVAFGFVPNTRSVNTGTGLLGGGDLSEDRTLYLDYGDGTPGAPLGVASPGLSSHPARADHVHPMVDLSGGDAGELTGILPMEHGGSGAALVPNAGGVLYSTTSALAIAAPGTVGAFLVSTGAGAPQWVTFSPVNPQKLGVANPGTSPAPARADHVHPAVDLTDPGQITGVLPPAHGGLGATNLTGYVIGHGTSGFTASPAIPVADVSGTKAQFNNSLTDGDFVFVGDHVPVADVDGAVPEAPIDGKQYARKDAAWAEVTAAALTPGSVVFAGTGGKLAEDNANLFWDDTNNRLGINQSDPRHPLDVNGDMTIKDGGWLHCARNGATYTSTIRAGVNFDGTNARLTFNTNNINCAQFGSDGTFNSIRGGIKVNQSGGGGVSLIPGDGTHSGYVQFRRVDDSAIGYIGYIPDAGGDMVINNNLGGVRFDNAVVITPANFWVGGYIGIPGSVVAKQNSGTAIQTWTPDNNYNAMVMNHLGAIAGTIWVTNTSTTYSSASDERLKANIADATVDTGAVIDAIKVRQFDWKSDNAHVRLGFVAQEVNPIYPEAVVPPTGEAELDVWMMDNAKMVPLLFKEIQSLRARLAAVEAKVP
jgi:hypothetical protein